MAEFTDKPGYSFNPGPPPEASRFFRNKDLRPSFSWQDVEPEEHAVAFAVAKAAHIDVLTAIQEELQTALDEGRTFASFKKDLRPRLKELGWWGHGEARDPMTGAAVPARLGTPRRLKTIYHANLRSARAAGQWERIERTKDAMPYLQYRLGPSENHRPHHAAKEGLVLPVGDPFWAQWYPPNGWGCKCWVRQLTRGQAEGIGVDASPPVPMRTVENTRTGEVKDVPVGIDPGWERNPGALRLRAAERFLAGKLDAADPAIARVVARDIATSWRVARIYGGAPGAAPVAILDAEIAARLGAETRVAQFSGDTASKQAIRHPEITAADYARLAELAERGEIRQVDARNIVMIGRGDLPWVAVFKRTIDRKEVYLATLYKAASGRYLSRLRHRTDAIRD